MHSSAGLLLWSRYLVLVAGLLCCCCCCFVAAVCLSSFSSLECDGDGIGIWAEPAWWRSDGVTQASSSGASSLASARKNYSLLLLPLCRVPGCNQATAFRQLFAGTACTFRCCGSAAGPCTCNGELVFSFRFCSMVANLRQHSVHTSCARRPRLL